MGKNDRQRNLNAGKSGNHRKYGPGTNGPVGCGLSAGVFLLAVGAGLYGLGQAVASLI